MISACEAFITSISEEINTRYSAKSEEYAKRVKDKKKKQTIEPEGEQNILAQAMSHVSEVILNELSSCYTIVNTEMEESCKKKNLKEDSDWEGYSDKFTAYQKIICRIFGSQ